MRFTHFAAAAAVACLALNGAVGATQQASTSTSAPPALVRLRLVVTPGVPATLAVHNGEMARLKTPDGAQYGLTPVVADGAPRLIVFRITQGGSPGSERLEQLARLDLSPETFVSYPAADPVFEVALLEIKPPAAAAQSSAIPAGPDGPCVRCCVTCDGVTACACAVQMDCGSCCCPDHCTCFGDGASASGCTAGSGLVKAPPPPRPGGPAAR